MKKAYLSVLLVLMLKGFCFSQVENKRDFEVRIKEWALGADNMYVITKDSIKVRKSSFGLAGKDKIFKLALTEEQSEMIFKPIKKISLNTYKEIEYKFSAPLPEGQLSDHGLFYDFVLLCGVEAKSFSITRYKIDFFYEFVKQVNLYLPIEYQIQYDDKYLNK